MLPTRESIISLTFPRADVAVVTLAGDHDLGTAKRLVQTFEELTPQKSVVVDLSGVTFFDTTTVHALVVGKRLADESGVGFVVHVPEGHPVARMLDLMRLLQLTPVSDTIERAVAAVAVDLRPGRSRGG